MQGKFCLPMVYRWGINCQAVSLKISLPLLMLKPHCIPWSSLRPKTEHHSTGCMARLQDTGLKGREFEGGSQLLSLLMTAWIRWPVKVPSNPNHSIILYMWNKNYGDGLSPTSGDSICHWMRICRATPGLYFLLLTGQRLFQQWGCKATLRVCGSTPSKSCILVWRMELILVKDVHNEI